MDKQGYQQLDRIEANQQAIMTGIVELHTKIGELQEEEKDEIEEEIQEYQEAVKQYNKGRIEKEGKKVDPDEEYRQE